MKKAVMGIGSLIMFIAVILAATIASAVLIRTAGVLQQKSYSTGVKARERITNMFNVNSVFATQKNETVNSFIIYSQLSISADTIPVKNVIIRVLPNNIIYLPDFNDNASFYNDVTKITKVCNVPEALPLDLDGDYKQDKIVLNGNILTIIMGSNFSITLNPTNDINGLILLNNTIFGNYSIKGDISSPCANLNITIWPSRKIGHYIYDKFNNNSTGINSPINPGDQIRFRFMSPPFYEDDNPTIQLMTKSGFITRYTVLIPQLLHEYVQVK